MGASFWLAVLAGALVMTAGAQAQVQYCEAPCPPCALCVQTPCPAIPGCPASAPCTVISNSNNAAPAQDDGGQSGGTGIGLGSIKGEGPNSTDGTAAGGATQVCCSCSCHPLVCPNVTCTAGPCNANGTVPSTATSSSTGGGHHKGLSNGQIGGIVGGILAAIAVFLGLWKYARSFANFFMRRQQPEGRRYRRDHRHRLRGSGTGATVTINIDVEPRSSAPASASASASSSAPTSPARSSAPSTAPPSPIMYGSGVPSIFGGADQDQEEQERPGCVVM